MVTKVAVVTGGNKGIGFATVKGLCEKYGGKVYLTARDEKLGITAVNDLKKLGLSPVFYQLNIIDQSSINKFRDHIKENDGGIDLLINNAAIAFNRCQRRYTYRWGNSAYVVSKVGVSALTIIHQREFDNEAERRDISVNSVHPGYVDTDMSSHKGPLTIQEGASAPLFLALEDRGLRGQFVWYDSTVVDWYAPSTPAVFLK